MTNLHCPTCQTALMEHTGSDCFDRWLCRAVFDCEVGKYEYPPAYSALKERALQLMDEVWKLDETAEIHRETIYLSNRRLIPTRISGPTFPVRVCRAAIYLASRSKSHD